MNTYLTLFFAISLEVLGTMLLPVISKFFKICSNIYFAVSYGLSFYLLAVISQKLSLAIIYASWSGLGIFSIAILSYIFYKQTLNWQSIVGLFVIVAGVTLVNLYRT